MGEVYKSGPYTKVFIDPPKIKLQGERMSEVTFGRLVRIPTAERGEMRHRYVDVTVADAKAEAKRLRKLAKQIRKACR